MALPNHGHGPVDHDGIAPLRSLREIVRREDELALNNPHISPFDIAYVSQLPLSRQAAALQRIVELDRRREAESLAWAEISRRLNESFQQQRVLLTEMMEAMSERLSTLAVANTRNQSSYPNLNMFPPPRVNHSVIARPTTSQSDPAQASALPASVSRQQNTSERQRDFERAEHRRNEVLQPQSSLAQPCCSYGSGSNSMEPERSEDNVDDHDQLSPLLQVGRRQKHQCPFCFKNFSISYLKNHVNRACKAAAQELNHREDWQCLRK